MRNLIALLVLVLAACDGPAPPSDGGRLDGSVPDASHGDAGPVCTRASDCDDGLYCNGTERCDPGSSAAPDGCLVGTPPCEAGQTCDETSTSCISSECPTDPDMRDADGDGHETMACPGGDDCDDDDPNRYPTNAETCDTHDEDCVATTLGDLDADGDTYVSSACSNGDMVGPDCDDANASVHPGVAETCDGHDDDCDLSVDEDTDATMPLCPGGMCTGGRCTFTGWDRTFGSAGTADRALSVALDGAGNVYIAGTFSGTVNVGGDTYDAVGSDDLFVLSYDPAGAVRWFVPVGSGANEHAKSITVSSDGIVYVSGSIGITHFDFGGGPRMVTIGTRLPFVLALQTADGAYVWDRVLGAEAALSATDDGVVVAASHNGTIDVGGPSPSDPVGTTGSDLHIIRYGSDGSYMWDARYGGAGTVFANDVSVSASSVVVSGDLLGSADLGDGTTVTPTGRDYYVASYALADGSNEWVHTMTGAGTQGAQAVATDGTNIYVVGTNDGTITFDDGISQTATTTLELYLLSLTAAGAYRWHTTQQASMSAAARGVDADPAGGAVVVGHFTGTINLGGGTWTSTRSGAAPSGFMAFFADDGSYVSDQPFAGGPEDGSAVYFEDVAAGAGGSVTIVGEFSGSADFGRGPHPSLGFDAVTLRVAR